MINLNCSTNSKEVDLSLPSYLHEKIEKESFEYN